MANYYCFYYSILKNGYLCDIIIISFFDPNRKCNATKQPSNISLL
jgi:hypothetical protein